MQLTFPIKLQEFLELACRQINENINPHSGNTTQTPA